MLKLIYIPKYIVAFLFLSILQTGIRTIYRWKKTNGEFTDWLDFVYDNNWRTYKVVLYEVFFLDLITCRRCGKLKAYKGKYCEECKKEILLEEI